MAENLFIRLPALPATAADAVVANMAEAVDDATVDGAAGGVPEIPWLLLDAASGIVRERGVVRAGDTTAALPELRGSAQIIVIVPGEAVLHTRVKVPSSQPRQIQQAVPFIVEELLAEEVDDQHFATGTRDAGGLINVRVVRLKQMAAWLEQLAALDILPHVLVTDCDCLPEAQAWFDGERALVHVEHDVLAIDTALLPEVVLRDTDAEETASLLPDLVCRFDEAAEADLSLLLDRVDAESGRHVVRTPLDHDFFESLCRAWQTEHAVNLLQKEFAGAAPSRGIADIWRPVARVAAMAFVVHVAIVFGQAVYFSMEERRLAAQTVELYQTIFPGDRPPRDVRRVWEARLRGDTGETSDRFLELLRAAGIRMSDAAVQLENLNYNESRGDLILQMRADSSDQLMTYAEGLTQDDMNASIGNINQEQNHVRGSLRLGNGSAR